jgi:hypothetical protein
MGPPISASPHPNAFGPSDCVDQPTGTLTSPLPDNFHVVVRVPDGWAREPQSPSQTQMLVLDAPAGYSHAPTQIALLSLMGYFPSETPADVAGEFYGPAPPGGHPEFAAQLVGEIGNCTVAGDSASFFQYSSQRSQIAGTGTPGQFSGYMIVFLHFHYAYGVRVEGTGGLDQQAVRDAKQILGSWTWTITSPPPR